MKFNYQTICYNTLLKDLSGRTRDVMVRRFGLGGERETLESIAKTYDITRERVRQIEEQGFKDLENKIESPVCQNVFRHFVRHLKASGSLQKEETLLDQLAGSKFKNHILFLLTLGKPFERFNETENFHSFWAIDKNSFNIAKGAINSLITDLKKKKQPMALPRHISPSYIEITKYILKSPEGLYGLRDWPEINPRGIKDRAYIVLKKEKKPLHFTGVASSINTSPLFKSDKPVISQTVHNELIKDQRFVLVGRGLYALREWGYESGVVREVISTVLQKTKRPMEKEEVVKKVLEQRHVKPNTILLNLQNKKYFKSFEGKYTIRKV